MGIRPEKVFLAAAGTEQSDGVNQLRGAVVTDVSYVGVSTQYLVRLPWDQELTVFEQNTGARDTLAVGDQVDLHWQPSHTFVLDAAQDALAGVETSTTRVVPDERDRPAGRDCRRLRPRSPNGPAGG